MIILRRLCLNSRRFKRAVRSKGSKKARKNAQKAEEPEIEKSSFYATYKYYIDSFATTAVMVAVIYVMQTWWYNKQINNVVNKQPQNPPPSPPENPRDKFTK